jgi:hypothetical protein
LQSEFPGLQAIWETKLTKEDWSQNEQRGQNQSLLARHDNTFRASVKTAVYVGFDGEPIPSQKWEDSYIKAINPDDSHGDNSSCDGSETPETDRQYYDEHLTIRQVKKEYRETPFWVASVEFTNEFIAWLYPNSNTQTEKRKFTRKLIDLYWVAFKEKPLICKELKLSTNGFEQRISRLKSKAEEFYKTRNRA